MSTNQAPCPSASRKKQMLSANSTAIPRVIRLAVLSSEAVKIIQLYIRIPLPLTAGYQKSGCQGALNLKFLLPSPSFHKKPTGVVTCGNWNKPGSPQVIE